ncbi:hypothetical protein GLOIN_2v346411 [Rhizophagus irregularis DAOM 181602=DAOM 197198]|uniref:Uncharacterized protein n=1 Tax=Rhizophagus irregularis (strain DAOM 181602 / DAOM 197198 / MUCL 43194) TaxID=747089 RepID=A0A2P4PMG6_RHIID|nr:hypothetical protein GLOIN_2v346411 [Rhizophagus irregularis DAOM 181602=DAOM 197198]POG66586.1 hypothetical protein GLOIN_2v346411 [Rhizophagus irregularis DAOM 181602=DAOM 197198]|eukprot:XP_025173452.1 hypothetical protein GLOIN_2v346411 [Rhizophagus irregularis DAOM 181602=DAOM 197198]
MNQYFLHKSTCKFFILIDPTLFFIISDIIIFTVCLYNIIYPIKLRCITEYMWKSFKNCIWNIMIDIKFVSTIIYIIKYEY